MQISTRNIQNFALLQANAGAIEKPVLFLKRRLSATIKEFVACGRVFIAEGNNRDFLFCERGIRSFNNSTRNVLDIAATTVLKGTDRLPVIIDPSHAAGRKDLIVPLARAGIAAGADGVIVDVHPTPETALCDGPQALEGADLRELAAAVRRLPELLGRADARDLIR